MGIRTWISDGRGTKKKAHLHQKNGDVGVIAFTKPLAEKKLHSTLLANDTFGIEMAVDASFSGTPDKIHDGTDTTLWTGSTIVGSSFDFASIVQSNGGTKSVEAATPNVGDVMQFAKGSDVTMANYAAVTLFVYVANNWASGDSVTITGYDTGLGVTVGATVALEDYFSEEEFNVWHKITIPLTDVGLQVATTVDAFRIQIAAKSGTRPTFYIDDVQLEESGGSVKFSAKAPPGSKFNVESVSFSIVDALDTTLLNNSMANLSYNKLLGETALANGIVLSRVQNEITEFSTTLKTVGDALKGGAVLTNSSICDGTNTHITLKTEFPKDSIILDSRKEDEIFATVNDSLTGLISFTTLLVGTTEVID